MKNCLIVGVLALLIGFFSGYYVNGLRWSAKLQTVEKSYSDAAAKASADALSQQQKAEADVAASDAKYTQELADAKNKIDILQHSVESGAVQLHVAATCSRAVPKTGTTSSQSDATTARLTDAAQRNYIDLRQRIEVANNQILALQDYINKTR